MSTMTIPPIIDRAIYDKTEKRRKTAKRVLHNPGNHLLQGRVKCGKCGHSVSPRMVNWSLINGKRIKRKVYTCVGRHAYSHPDGSPKCDLANMSGEWLEEEVKDALLSAFRDPAVLKQHIQRYLDSLETQLADLEAETGPIQQDIDKLEREAENWGTLHVNGDRRVRSRQQYEEKVRPLRLRIASLESTILSNGEVQHDIDALRDRRASIHGLLAGEDWHQKKQVKVWGSGEEFFLQYSDRMREFMERHEVTLKAFHDRVEITGLIPTQVVRLELDRLSVSR